MNIALTVTLTLGALAASASAQSVHLVNAAGTPFPLGTVSFPIEPPPTFTVPLALSPDGHVYAALDASLPSGYYLFDVVNVFLVSISQLPVEDRVFYAANNGAAGFTLTRVSTSPSLPAMGDGLGGIGDSMPVFPFNSPQLIENRPDLTCVQKMILYGLGATPTGTPTAAGFEHFRAGDGSPGTISGTVFEDFNQNGVRNPGEPGVGGCPIQLVSNNPSTPGQVMASTSTAPDGTYLFSQVGYDDCSVVLVLNTQLYIATTPTDVRLSNCGCGPHVVNFGKYTIQHNCNGHTIGYWRNNHGVAAIVNGGFWDELAALNLVSANGTAFNPTGTVSQWTNWLKNANAVNMAYMLSAQLAAMQLNVLSGGVGTNCWVQTAQGPMSIVNLMAAANAALAADSYTPSGDPNRAPQELLKNALDAANNNLNWL
ncbi:MAG: SdrD B-like domain-containing protein [Planctomycetota bacterium]